MRALAAAGAAAVALVLVACSDNSASTTASNESIDLGAQVYEARCASCHGAQLQGTDRGPSHLSIVYEPGHHPDESIRSAIVRGAPQHHWDFGPMPAIEGLDAAEVEAVIDFIRSEQLEQGFQR